MIYTSGFRSRNRLRFSAIACSLALVFAASAPAAKASTFTVSNLADAGAGSLRDAITLANGNVGADEIVFQAGLTGAIVPASELPTITEALTITGPGARDLTITGSNTRRVLAADAPLTIVGIRLANGFTDRGGGIRFNSTSGPLHVSDCHFDQHLATLDGGAICMLAGSASIERCTFTTDQAAGSGGCIWYGQGGGSQTMTITNCTFVNNFASSNGGALRQFDNTAYAAAVTNCTFVVNNAGTFGGAIAVSGGTMTILNSLFTANGAGGNPGGHIGTTAGTTTSLGHNLFGHLDGSNITPDASDRFGTPAAQLNTGILIAFPFNNGGLTDTLPMSNNSSIAIDGGGVAGAPTTDQRGFARMGCAPDVGAFELQTPPDADGDGVFDHCDACAGTAAGAHVDATGCPPPPSNPCDGSPDDDGDGVINCFDLCPLTPGCASVNASGCPTDSDGDGVFDGCDTCSGTPAGAAVDANGCPTADEDGDGVFDVVDACLGTPACAIASVGIDGCPADADGDGIFDGCDACSETLAGDPVDANGCSTADEDGDGVLNDVDVCRGTAACAIAGVDADGCPVDSDDDGIFDGCDQCPGANDLTDTDGDGIPDCLDACPTTGDADGDGVQDCADGCPNDRLKLAPGTCGCGTVDTNADADGDGVIDCLDTCPLTPACASVDQSGCPVDSDGDGVADGCEQTAGEPVPGSDGPTAGNNGPCGFGALLGMAMSMLLMTGLRLRRRR